MNPYYLVKIIDKKWADRLLDGEVFMRPPYPIKPLDRGACLVRKVVSKTCDLRNYLALRLFTAKDLLLLPIE